MSDRAADPVGPGHDLDASPDPHDARGALDALDAPRPPMTREARQRTIDQARQSVEHARALTRWLAELSERMPTSEELAVSATTSALATIGADVVMALRVVDEVAAPRLELQAGAELPPAIAGSLAAVPLALEHPLTEAVRTARPVVCATRAELVGRYPAAAPLADALGAQAFCAVPLVYLGRARGVLGLAFTEARALERGDLSLLRTLGARYARSLYHARAFYAERAARTEAEAARLEAEQARGALAEAHAALERRVTSRTAELARANAMLADQVAQRARVEAERDALRRQLAAVEEAERRRIARELHDQLGQHLTAFGLALAELQRVVPGPPEAHARIAQLAALTRDMTRDARSLALQLRPPELDDVGLESALVTYVEQWRLRYDVDAEVTLPAGAMPPLPPEVATALYRIAQEALTNVARHARARQVSVLLDRAGDEVRLLVEDDGVGFDPAAPAARPREAQRLGLAGMRERAALVGGTVDIESSPGRGTTLYVRIPVAAAAPARLAAPVPAP